MTEQDVQSIREQAFGKPSTPAATPEVPANENPVIETPADTPAADVPPVIPTEEVVDENDYLNELGYKTLEEAKQEITSLRQLKEAAPKPIEYANEESKKVHELILAGKTKEVKAILDLQEKLESVEALSPADAIKFHIEQTNKHFKKADVEDVFEEKYALPEKPIRGQLEDDEEFAQRESRYNAAVDKVSRKIERDAVTAREDLLKLKSEIKLPEIPQPINEEMENFNAYKESVTKASEDHQILTSAISKLSEKDISIQLSFNDEASKMKFDVSYVADKEGTDKAKTAAANYGQFLATTYYNEDGSPRADKLAQDIYFLQNREKIMTEQIKQAVNETKAWFLRNQKNIGEGIQRNFNIGEPDAVQKLKEQVFG